MISISSKVVVKPGEYNGVVITYPTHGVVKDCDCFGGANMYQVEVKGELITVTDLNLG